VLVRPKAPDNPTFETARWSDSLPKLIQAKIVQSFENAKNIAAVSRPTDGFNADYQLLIEIRTFEISTDPDTAAVVELSAKVLGTDGKVVGSRVFRSSLPTKVSDAAAAAAVLNEAFGNVARDLVMWTAETIKT
jgi:phospholipid/cholesterol/gamma-HCH transport system substrate-binding protein